MMICGLRLSWKLLKWRNMMPDHLGPHPPTQLDPLRLPYPPTLEE
ncbi:hypothetical protein CASFOL_033392 [Castilleja foliolosa]|uniref:Uncharacterized protein n=1 Tax=Castilleja foliolosa TaxID=1961234 RepID=A0ABD3BZR0_9LAMI